MNERLNERPNDRHEHSKNDLLKSALRKIKRDEKCRPNCCVVVGPTGPTHTVKSVIKK